MQKIIFAVLLIIPAFLFLSCDKVNSSENKQNELGGDTNIPVNTPGNTIESYSIVVGDSVYDIGQSVSVVKFENNITTLNVKADLRKIPQLARLIDYIPPQYIDSAGKFNANLDFKITSEGIQDFTNRDHKAHTIVKYDCKVGDHYDYTKSNGQTISRVVTARSDSDDYYWGFILIKVITVEQDSRIPGVSKIIYKANHRFGLVSIELVMEDGSTAGTQLYD